MHAFDDPSFMVAYRLKQTFDLPAVSAKERDANDVNKTKHTKASSGQNP